jgi:hypothetical protein
LVAELVLKQGATSGSSYSERSRRPSLIAIRRPLYQAQWRRPSKAQDVGGVARIVIMILLIVQVEIYA